MKKTIQQVAALCCALSATQGVRAEGIRAVPGEFVVKFRNGVSSIRGLSANGLRVQEELDQRGEWALVKTSRLDLLKKNPDVLSVEPNYIYSLPAYKASGLEETWGIRKVKAPEAWEKAGRGSPSVTVAIVDTGIDYTHPDLKSHTAMGYNAITDAMDGMDDHSHGTHVAGTIAGDGAIFGVAPGVRLVPSKFLNKDGSGTLSDAIKAIRYAMDSGAQVMSNSWGGGGYSDSLAAVISEYCDKGGIFVAAAGNGGMDGVGDNNDRTPSYPASYKLKCVISVAASDENDKLASFSNFGKTVHLAAPGVNVYSSVPGGKYDTYSGTSMATPHVSGAVALLLSRSPGMDASSVIAALQAASEPMKFSAWDKFLGKKLGSGRLNAFNLFK